MNLAVASPNVAMVYSIVAIARSNVALVSPIVALARPNVAVVSSVLALPSSMFGFRCAKCTAGRSTVGVTQASFRL